MINIGKNDSGGLNVYVENISKQLSKNNENGGRRASGPPFLLEAHFIAPRGQALSISKHTFSQLEEPAVAGPEKLPVPLSELPQSPYGFNKVPVPVRVLPRSLGLPRIRLLTSTFWPLFLSAGGSWKDAQLTLKGLCNPLHLCLTSEASNRRPYLTSTSLRTAMRSIT